MPDEPINDAIFKALNSESAKTAVVAAVGEFTRLKMSQIEHVPAKYYLPDAPKGALDRLYRELREQGHIKMHPDAWVPQCLVDDGIESLPVKTTT